MGTDAGSDNSNRVSIRFMWDRVFVSVTIMHEFIKLYGTRLLLLIVNLIVIVRCQTGNANITIERTA